MARDPYVQVGGSKGGGKNRAHRVIAARALGRSLPPGVEVHHFDGDKRKNNDNLVVCESRAYHRLLEARTRALAASGHADWRKCDYCKQYDDPKNLRTLPRPGKSERIFHRGCSNRARANRAAQHRRA